MSYYIRLKGKAFGPFDEAQLVDMKTKGRVSRTTEISVNKTDWQTAEVFEFLYQPQQTYTPPPPPLNFGTQAPAAQPASPGTAGADVSVGEPKDWFYSVDGNNGYGPVPQSAIVQMIQNGTLHGEGYVWQEGQTAQFIKSVSPFDKYFKTDESSTGGNAWNPLERSVGWLMFLKIVWLIWWIIIGIAFIANAIYSLSMAVANDHVTFLIGVLIGLLIAGGYYYLMFRPFLSLWKYHDRLQKAVLSHQDGDLVAANQELFQFWRNLGILLIVTLAILLLAVIVVLIIAGMGTGWTLPMRFAVLN